MLISELKIGQRARVTRYARSQSGYKQKLLALGLTPGVEFSVLKKAPLGCPILISFRTTQLALRMNEASVLEVEPV